MPISIQPLIDLLNMLPADVQEELRLEGGNPETIAISGITQNSRKVQKGSIFVAIDGTQTNGEQFIPQAIAAGAAVIVCRQEALPQVQGAPALITDNPRKLVSLLAAAFYQPQPPCMVAVTGTDGKTSTAELVRQFWELLEHPALSIGTLGLTCNKLLRGLPTLTDNTSPEPVSFYETLSVACSQGIYHAVCEASSHGIHQYRLEGLDIACAVFTSFSQDHLDYHGTMDAYFAAKRRLFDELLSEDGTAVICTEEPRMKALAEELQEAGRDVLTYSTKDADLLITAITPIPSGQHIVFTFDEEEYELNIPLFGEFQVYNVLAAALAVYATTDIHIAEIIAHAHHLTPIKGRLQLAGETEAGALIFVDYAHTPAALEKALTTLRPYASHHLHVVFGCGGDRDKTKRPLMGKAAAQYADKVIVTDDNPRTEDAATIRTEVLAGCPQAANIGNRREAITEAIRHVQRGDVLLIAGKGHEDYQIIGTTKHHSDDVEIVQDVIGEMMLHDQ